MLRCTQQAATSLGHPYVLLFLADDNPWALPGALLVVASEAVEEHPFTNIRGPGLYSGSSSEGSADTIVCLNIW